MKPYSIHDYIKCKYQLETFPDICNSNAYIMRRMLGQPESLYRVQVNYIDPNVFLKEEDRQILHDAVEKWKTIIIEQVKPNSTFDMVITVYVETRDPNILASATCTSTHNGVSDAGSVWINTSNWAAQKQLVKEDGNTQAYYTILHELGHVFGIGTISAWSNYITNHVYTGPNGVREYKKTIDDDTVTGLPIENDGGAGTSGSHLEEGAEYVLSNNNRYHDGHFHPGLDRELMTGWAENDTGVEPLSRISVALLQDLGFIVNYTKADNFVPETTGILNVGEVITIETTQMTIQTEKNFLEYFVPTGFNKNSINVASNQMSRLYAIYYQFSGDLSIYSDTLKQNGTVVNEIKITGTPQQVDVVPVYQAKPLQKVLLFFRN